MNKVKQMMAAGVSLPTAVKELLTQNDPPMTLTEFAQKYGRAVTTISNVINGNTKPSDDDIAALIAQFGGDSHEWRMLLWEQMRPITASA